jgi:hypothetical protein
MMRQNSTNGQAIPIILSMHAKLKFACHLNNYVEKRSVIKFQQFFASCRFEAV